jgi:prophage antirepressor-like protein
MNDLQFFHNDDFGRLRGFLDEDGNPWFVAKDVCDALGLSNVSVTLDSLDDDERSKFNLGRQGFVNVVSEPGLYSLIMRSRKPEAKAFKRWITHEVIPSIRKTGQYRIGQPGESIHVTVVTQPGEFIDLTAYVSTLRQMARQKFYPDQMRAGFLAEAASLLSGYSADRFMPPETFCCYPLFN